MGYTVTAWLGSLTHRRGPTHENIGDLEIVVIKHDRVVVPAGSRIKRLVSTQRLIILPLSWRGMRNGAQSPRKLAKLLAEQQSKSVIFPYSM